MSLINQTVEASVRSVRAFVQQYMSLALEQARASITTYAERFTHAMIIALTTSEKGEKVHLLLHATIAQCSLSTCSCNSAGRQMSLVMFPDVDSLHHLNPETLSPRVIREWCRRGCPPWNMCAATRHAWLRCCSKRLHCRCDSSICPCRLFMPTFWSFWNPSFCHQAWHCSCVTCSGCALR